MPSTGWISISADVQLDEDFLSTLALSDLRIPGGLQLQAPHVPVFSPQHTIHTTEDPGHFATNDAAPGYPDASLSEPPSFVPSAEVKDTADDPPVFVEGEDMGNLRESGAKRTLATQTGAPPPRQSQLLQNEHPTTLEQLFHVQELDTPLATKIATMAAMCPEDLHSECVVQSFGQALQAIRKCISD